MYMQTFPVYKKAAVVSDASHKGSPTFKLFQQSVDENVSCLTKRLTQTQLLLNSIRRFDKYLIRLQVAAMVPITVGGCSPRNNDSDGTTKSAPSTICSFFQDTNQGRGLKYIKEAMREAPRSGEAQIVCISVLLNALLCLDEVDAAQHAFAKDALRVEGLLSIAREGKEAVDENRSRRMTMVAHWKRAASSVVPPAHQIAPAGRQQHSTSARRSVSSLAGVLDNIATLERRCSSRHRNRSLRGVLPLRSPYFDKNGTNGDGSQGKPEGKSKEEEIRKNQEQARWLPRVATTFEGNVPLVEGSPDGASRCGARAIDWVEEIIEMDFMQLCLVAMHNIKEPGMQLICLATVHMFIKLGTSSATAQLTSPLRKNLFLRACLHDPYQTTPSSRDFAVRQITSKIGSMPTGISILLHTMDIHTSRFDVQGAAASVLVAALTKGNHLILEKIGDAEAFHEQQLMQAAHTQRAPRASLGYRTNPSASNFGSTSFHGGKKSAAMLLIRMLLRWNFLTAQWTTAARNQSAELGIAPAEQPICADAHRNITLALFMLLNRDEISRTIVHNDAQAASVLLAAGRVHCHHDTEVAAEVSKYCSRSSSAVGDHAPQEAHYSGSVSCFVRSSLSRSTTEPAHMSF